MAPSKAGIILEAQNAGQYFATLGRADEANAAFAKSSEAAAKQVAEFGQRANQIKLSGLNNQLADQKTKLSIATAELAKMGNAYDFTSKAAQNKAAALRKLEGQIGLTEQKISLLTAKMQAEAQAATQSATATDKVTKEFADVGGATAKSEQNIGSLIGTVGKLGAAYLGVSELAGKAFEGFALGAELDQSRRTLGTLLGDVEKGNQVYAAAIKFGQQYGYTQQEMASAAAAAAGIFKKTNETTEKTLEVLGRLASLNPAEGFEGATFALKELASGDIMSLVERFNLAKTTANEMKQAIADGADPVKVLDQALSQLGVSSDVLSQRMEGQNGALLRVKLAGEGLLLGLGQLLEAFGATYILEAFAAGLQTIAQGMAWVASGITQFVNESALMNTALSDGAARMLESGRSFDEYRAAMASIGEEQNALSQEAWNVALALQQQGMTFQQAAGAVSNLSTLEGELRGALISNSEAAQLSEKAQSDLIVRTLALAAASPEAAGGVEELIGALQDGDGHLADFTAGLEVGEVAAINHANAVADDSSMMQLAAADAEYAASANDAHTASIYDVTDSTYEKTEASLNAAIAAENEARFQDDLTAATYASGDSATAAAIFSTILAAQYGLEANEVSNLIALTNELNKSRAGQAGNAAAQGVARAVAGITHGQGQAGARQTHRTNVERASRAKTKKGGRGGGGSKGAGKGAGGSKAKEKEIDPVEEAQKAAEDAGKIAESLAKLRTFIAPSQADIDAYTGALAMIVQSFGQRAGEVSGALTEETGKFAKTAGEVVDTVGKGVEAFKKLQDYTSPPRENLQAFTDDMAAIVREFGARAAELNVDLASDTILFSTTAEKAIGTVAKGVEAFKLLADFAPIPEVNIALFSLAVRDAVRAFGERTKEVDLRLADDTAIFSDTATKAIGTVADGVEAFKLLADFAPIPEVNIGLFSLAVRDTVRAFSERTKEINLDLLDSTADFADTAGKAIGIIADGVEGFAKLADYSGVPQAKLELFGRDVSAAVRITQAIAQQFDTEGVAAAAAFADSAGRVIAPIGSAVDAFSSLKEYEGVAPERMGALFYDMRAAINLMIVISTTADEEGVAAATAFSASVTTVFEAMSGGIDALDALRDYEAVAPERMAAFEYDFNTAVATMERLAGAGTVLEAQGAAWKTSLENFANSVRAGMDAIGSLNGLNVNVSASVSASAGAGGEIPAMAWGGRPEPGLPVLVGDNNGRPTRYSELFIPDQAGTILPAGMTRQVLGLGGAGYRPPASAQQQFNDYQTSQIANITNNYTLGVTTNQSPQVVEQGFGRMQALARAGL